MKERKVLAVLCLLLPALLLEGLLLINQNQRIEKLENMAASEPTEPWDNGDPMETRLLRTAELARASTVVVNVYDAITVHQYADTFDEVEGTEVEREVLAGQGSGVIVGEDLVLTCAHITADRKRLGVEVFGQPEREAQVLSADEKNDLSLLRVPGLGGKEISFGDPPILGQPVLCVGNPASDKLAGTVTFGIVSAPQREMGSLLTEGETVTVFQTDAAINGGCSGGGIFDLQGRLLGIVSRKYVGTAASDTQLEGIGMCIPIEYGLRLLQTYEG